MDHGPWTVDRGPWTVDRDIAMLDVRFGHTVSCVSNKSRDTDRNGPHGGHRFDFDNSINTETKLT
jgi:hypothetical protein